ncbi:MAG: F0F1 ATP synthase subunit delta, partial [Pseudomonadota bacterium]
GCGNDARGFRVDPAILGGLVVRVGDKVLDGSVAGQLETMRQVMNDAGIEYKEQPIPELDGCELDDDFSEKQHGKK